MYGYQWTHWEKYTETDTPGLYEKSHINQIKEVIDLLKNSPDSRRMVVTAWNPSVLDEIALPSCHAFFIFNVINALINLRMKTITLCIRNKSTSCTVSAVRCAPVCD